MNEERSLLEFVQEQLASEETRLPVFDPVAARLREIVAGGDFSVDQIEETLVGDPGLVAEVLRQANSSFFRGLEKVATVREAVLRLGASEVNNLATMASVRRNFRSDDPLLQELMSVLWRHSVACAVGSRWLAKRTHDASLAPRAFIAGLLHDAGKLLLLRVLDEIRSSDRLDAAGRKMVLSRDLVLHILDAMHATEGHSLLTKWNLPPIYAEIARDHHAAEVDLRQPLLAIVRLADLACRKVGFALAPDPSVALLVQPEAHALGLSELALAEFEIALEDSAELAG